MILPFYQIYNNWFHGGVIFQNYWTFKYYSYTLRFKETLASPDYFFFDYWFGQNGSGPPFLATSSLGQNVASALMGAFGIQLSTIVVGLASLFFKKRILLVAPFCLSLTVLGLMTYSEKEIYAYGTNQLGYWLLIPSTALFLSAFILNEVTKKQQTKDSISV